MNRNEELLREAIRTKSPVYTVYGGRKRWLCPHTLGYKKGDLHLLAYQYAGESSSRPIVTPTDPNNGPAEYWRCMEVADMRELAVLPPGPWYTCHRHSQRQTCVDQVLVEVVAGPLVAT